MQTPETKTIELSLEDQDVLNRLNKVAGQDGIQLLLDHDVHLGLCQALSLMGSSTLQLLQLLAENQVMRSLPESASEKYKSLLAQVNNAAEQAARDVLRSQRLDRAVFLAVLPEPCTTIQ